jgi:hypothetical protein
VKRGGSGVVKEDKEKQHDLKIIITAPDVLIFFLP